MILLIDNYDSFTYNIYQYLRELGKKVDVIKNDSIVIDSVQNKYEAVIISPGPGTPRESGKCLEIINKFHNQLPILGVCLGHQSIGEYFGAKIIHSPEIAHGYVDRIYHTNHPLFEGLNNPFNGTRYHSLQLSFAKNLPLEIIGKTIKGDIMGLAHKKYPVYGVQFHPESYETKDGIRILKNFIKIYSEYTYAIS